MSHSTALIAFRLPPVHCDAEYNPVQLSDIPAHQIAFAGVFHYSIDIFYAVIVIADTRTTRKATECCNKRFISILPYTNIRFLLCQAIAYSLLALLLLLLLFLISFFVFPSHYNLLHFLLLAAFFVIGFCCCSCTTSAVCQKSIVIYIH